MKLHRAEFHTRHFEFEATSRSKRGATEELLHGLMCHGRQHALPAKWWMQGFGQLPVEEIFEYHEVYIDCCYRDNEQITY